MHGFSALYITRSRLGQFKRGGREVLLSEAPDLDTNVLPVSCAVLTLRTPIPRRTEIRRVVTRKTFFAVTTVSYFSTPKVGVMRAVTLTLYCTRHAILGVTAAKHAIS